MKKIILILTLTLTCFSVMSKRINPNSDFSGEKSRLAFSAAQHETSTQTDSLIKTLDISIDGNKGVVALYGTKTDEIYYTDVYASVKTENSSYNITLADGYSPDMWYLNFTENEKFLFFSSQTGGSGGYGNYGVFRLSETSYDTLYTNVSDSNSQVFSAEFVNGGKMVIKDLKSGGAVTINVKYMDKNFYNQIFTKKGKVKGEAPYVNDVSFVAPVLNGATGVYDLITYRSVAAIAEVNRLGYITQNLSFSSLPEMENKENIGRFSPYFTSFSINF